MPLSWNEIRVRASDFAQSWENYQGIKEQAEAQTFENEFFNIFGVERRKVALFEHNVHYGDEQQTLFDEGKKGKEGRIDLIWKGYIIIEMKTPGIDLEEAYNQAKKYALSLPANEIPKGILTCDFAVFDYYDLEKGGEKTSFPLADLPKYVELFGYLAGYGKTDFEKANPVDIEAAERMGELHDALKETGYEGHDLEVYLVRLLFCLFADHTGIFDPKNLFFRYITERTSEDGSDLAFHIEAIFDALNRHPDKRLKNLDEQLKKFPYVDGGLFEERIQPASFDSKMRRTLLKCCTMDWGQIKPEIFGAMFQGVMDEAKRRALGEHYTAEQNIMKVITALFLDDLQAELDRIKRMKSAEKKHRLLEFHEKLVKLKFLDPACGCGNFLVVSYRALRRLEIETLKEYLQGEKVLDIEIMIRVNVDQFYGIEIEEFPVQVARTAMWLMDHLMNNEASAAFGKYIARLPLTTAAKIVHANAIPLDWESVVPKSELTYILGNPPFAGASMMSEAQKKDTVQAFNGLKGCNSLDYVTCWYKKAAEYIKDTSIEAAFVSTNSICQGEQVPILWPELLNKHGIKLNFAHQTFKWWNEARNKAAVFCIILGFSRFDRPVKRIYVYDTVQGTPSETLAQAINPYLINGPSLIIQKRSSPLCDTPKMVYGSKLTDGGNYLFTQEEKDEFLKLEPGAEPFFRVFIGSHEYINNVKRYCLWIAGIAPAELRKLPHVLKRVEAVKKMRLESTSSTTREAADRPTEFFTMAQPDTDYLVFPEVSSERRRYIPIGFIRKDIIASNKCLVIPSADLYIFGVLTSNFHMVWTRYITGRLKSDFQYSASIVYNNFPWPGPTAKQKEAVEKAAQGVLDARAGFPESSLADLYDPLTMPPALVKAHQSLDRAVEKAYGKEFTNDADRVAHLFYLYQKLTEGLIAKKTRRKNL